MASIFARRVRLALAPPRYLTAPMAGIDISTSGVKGVRLVERAHGLVLAGYAEEYLPPGAFADGDLADPSAIVATVQKVLTRTGITSASVALPEAKSYLFETAVEGATKEAWKTLIEQRLDELVPLPPIETVYDITSVAPVAGQATVVGVGFARRIVDRLLSVLDEAGLLARALDGETFAMARALVPEREGATLIIDVGKSTTKLAIVEGGIPRFAATVAIGGHAFTLAIEKHFGVDDDAARRIKIERGIVPAAGNEDYLAAMLSTVSAIRDEIATRLEYWQSHKARQEGHGPVTGALLVGGNATVRGLPEYLSGALGIPVSTGDVFSKFAPREYWIPEIDYAESLAYATAIGLALRTAPKRHA